MQQKLLQRSISFFASIMFVLSSVIYFGYSLFIELKFPFFVYAYLFLEGLIFLVVMTSFFFLPTYGKNRKKIVSILKILLGCTTFLFVIYAVFRLLNIYELGTLPSWFFKLKLYRLITLSPLFFIRTLSSLGILLLITLKKEVITQYSISFLQFFFFTCIFLIFFVQAQQALGSIVNETFLASKSLETPFADRFTYLNGGLSYYGWIWPYTRFIIAHTPTDAVIMIPPQSNVWKMEGNNAYLRWFIYPRKMTVINLDHTIPPQTQYVLIAQGECAEGTCGWPKIKIPKEQIEEMIFINRETLQEEVVTGRDFEPATDGMKWGIIKLKQK
jgi:hypothetical protein